MKIDFLREEFEAEYQNKLAEYEEELRRWKKEAKRRVTLTKRRVFFCFLTATALVIIWFVYRVEQKRARQEGQDSSLTSERDGSDEGRKNLKRFQS